MQWWDDFVTWFNSADGERVLTTAVLPFIAIVVAGVIAALIGRASARRVLEHQDHELKGAAIMALIGAGRKAAIWSSLGLDEKQHVDSLVSEADIRVRLLPVNGASAAADWAAHELNAMKKNSATFSFQAEQTFVDYRDRLLEWQDRPRRARKLFAFDLEQWRYEDDGVDKDLVKKQQEWASKQANTAPKTAATAVVPTAASPSATPAAATAAQATAAPAAAAPAAASSTTASSSAASTPTAAAPIVVPATEPVKAAASVPSVPSVPSAPTESSTLTGAATETKPIDLSEDDNTDDAEDAEVIGDSNENFAPPVTAGTVRQRIAPDTTIDEDR